MYDTTLPRRGVPLEEETLRDEEDEDRESGVENIHERLEAAMKEVVSDMAGRTERSQLTQVHGYEEMGGLTINNRDDNRKFGWRDVVEDGRHAREGGVDYIDVDNGCDDGRDRDGHEELDAPGLHVLVESGADKPTEPFGVGVVGYGAERANGI
jgi:hypothetical protein